MFNPATVQAASKRVFQGVATRALVNLHSPDSRITAKVVAALSADVSAAGGRGGKTTFASSVSIDAFLDGLRILYATPTADQLQTYWYEVTTALGDMIHEGVYRKNEANHSIERPGTRERIRAKTAWNADTLRGDYADLLILDEWQMMDERAWDRVGAPMLADNDGDAIFIYTPPSLASRSASKARDAQHAAKMFAEAAHDQTGRWAAFTWPSKANPHISDEALRGLVHDMTSQAYRQEIMAEDVVDVPGALWNQATIDSNRVTKHPPLVRVGVGVDPPGGATECGIVAAGVGPWRVNGKQDQHAFVIMDKSLRGSPHAWASEVVSCYHLVKADRIFGEKNFGGDMVESAVRTVDATVSYQDVYASRGKAVRAEPVAALYEQGRVHHVGLFPELEAEMTSWLAGESAWSPNRVDALVWILTMLMLSPGSKAVMSVPQVLPGTSYWTGLR